MKLMNTSSYKVSFTPELRNKMQFVSPLFWTQLRILKLRYGTLVSAFFLFLHRGEISVQNLKLWDTTLSLLFKFQKWITWIVIVMLIAYLAWIYGVAVALDSNLYNSIRIFLYPNYSYEMFMNDSTFF